MSRSRHRPKAKTPGDGCWLCRGRPRALARYKGVLEGNGVIMVNGLTMPKQLAKIYVEELYDKELALHRREGWTPTK